MKRGSSVGNYSVIQGSCRIDLTFGGGVPFLTRAPCTSCTCLFVCHFLQFLRSASFLYPPRNASASIGYAVKTCWASDDCGDFGTTTHVTHACIHVCLRWAVYGASGTTNSPQHSTPFSLSDSRCWLAPCRSITEPFLVLC